MTENPFEILKLPPTASPEEIVRQGARLSFRFHGTGDEQAELLSKLTGEGVRVRAFEEQKSSFEDILVQVAEGNRSRND